MRASLTVLWACSVQDSSLTQPSEASRDLVKHLLGRNLSPDGHGQGQGQTPPQDSAAVTGDVEQRYSDSHPVSTPPSGLEVNSRCGQEVFLLLLSAGMIESSIGLAIISCCGC